MSSSDPREPFPWENESDPAEIEDAVLVEDLETNDRPTPAAAPRRRRDLSRLVAVGLVLLAMSLLLLGGHKKAERNEPWQTTAPNTNPVIVDPAASANASSSASAPSSSAPALPAQQTLDVAERAVRAALRHTPTFTEAQLVERINATGLRASTDSYSIGVVNVHRYASGAVRLVVNGAGTDIATATIPASGR